MTIDPTPQTLSPILSSSVRHIPTAAFVHDHICAICADNCFVKCNLLHMQALLTLYYVRCRPRQQHLTTYIGPLHHDTVNVRLLLMPEPWSCDCCSTAAWWHCICGTQLSWTSLFWDNPLLSSVGQKLQGVSWKHLVWALWPLFAVQ